MEGKFQVDFEINNAAFEENPREEVQQILVNYDSMGIGGGEGYVSLYYKPAAAARKAVAK